MSELTDDVQRSQVIILQQEGYSQRAITARLNVSKTAVQKTWRRYRATYHPARKPILSTKDIRDRLAFCRQHANWTEYDWDKVMFSDETLIKQFSSNRRVVRPPKGQRYNFRYTAPIVKHSPSIMIWGAISSKCRGPLWFAPPKSTINARLYLSILQEKFPESLVRSQCEI